MNTEQIAKTLLEIADCLKKKDDPYAELKAAHKAGKVIQFSSAASNKWDNYTRLHPDYGEPSWNYPLECYRIEEPETSFTLPSCAPGMEWHRPNGWKPDDLPQGWRPLVLKEPIQKGDEAWQQEGWWSTWDQASNIEPVTRHRTRRPLVFTYAGKQWTWHRPGDPMPCDGEREVQVILVGGKSGLGYTKKGDVWLWNERGGNSIIGWRYTGETKTVPLGPEDVMPFTVIRRKGETETWHWRTVSYVDAVKVTCGNRGYEWDELASDYERNESIPLTGRWNPSAWEPCHKPTPENG